MNFKTVPLLALLAVPGLAQERWQAGMSLNTQIGQTVEYQSNASQFLRFDRKDSCSPSLLAGYRAWDFGKSDLSFTGEYQFPKEFDLETITIHTPRNVDGRNTTWFRSESWAPGVQLTFHHAVEWGFNLQYRLTRLQTEGYRTTHNRPWLGFHVGRTFRTDSRVKPFLALRSSVALTRTQAPEQSALLATDPSVSDNANRQLMRSLDGRLESSLQLGVRF